MSTDSEDERQRNRGPTFSSVEINLLLDLIEKNKKAVLSRDIKSSSVKARENAWKKMQEEFNSTLNCERSIDSLKNKWRNLRTTVRKVSSTMGSTESDFDLNRVNTILNKDNRNSNQDDFESGSDDSNSKTPRNRSINFTPEESKLLLECVKEFKDVVLNPAIDTQANALKVKAWNKVTERFNSHNYKHRSLSCLKNKFKTMKAMAKNKMAQNTRRSSSTPSDAKRQRIKQEPDNYEDCDLEDSLPADDEMLSGGRERTLFPTVATTNDPLDIVLNGPVINDPMCNSMEESSEVVKKKLELLKYQTETAELERKRLLERMSAEQMEENQRATEMALRLRAARLEVAAAESRLPPGHPALVFHPEETLAQSYLHMNVIPKQP